MENIFYDDNSSKRYRNIPMHELEENGYTYVLQTPHTFGFNDNIYHQGNFSRLPDFDVFFLFKIFVNVTNGHIVDIKIGI